MIHFLVSTDTYDADFPLSQQQVPRNKLLGGDAPVCPTEEAPKIATFKAPVIPTLFLSRLLYFRQLIFFSFLVKIGLFEGLNKVFEKRI